MEIEPLSEARMIEIASKAYGEEEFPESYDQATKHQVGDTLADFIVVELVEGGDGYLKECSRVMRKAAEQLVRVAEAFEEVI